MHKIPALCTKEPQLSSEPPLNVIECEGRLETRRPPLHPRYRHYWLLIGASGLVLIVLMHSGLMEKEAAGPRVGGSLGNGGGSGRPGTADTQLHGS